MFKAEDYVYSSAIEYAGRKGMLDVIVIKQLRMQCFLFATKRYRLQIGTSVGQDITPLFSNPDATVRQTVFSESTGVGRLREGHRVAFEPHNYFLIYSA